MGYDHGDSFTFDFKPNGSTIDSKLKGKLLPGSFPIQSERKWKDSFLSVMSISSVVCDIYNVDIDT